MDDYFCFAYFVVIIIDCLFGSDDWWVIVMDKFGNNIVMMICIFSV